MDDEELKPTFTIGRVITALLVITFGWGSLWAGSAGIKMAFNRANGSIDGNVAAVSGTSADYIRSLNTSPVAVPASIEPYKKLVTDLAVNLDTEESSSLKIIIGGDVMFDRTIRVLGKKYGYDSLLAPVADIFKENDIAVVNLEGTITSYPSKTLMPDGKTSKELAFTFPVSSAKTLAQAHVTAVSLANNHTSDFGTAGVKETRKRLTDAGVKWFGDFRNASGTDTVISKNGIDVAFVGYHAFQPGFPKILAAVKRLSDEGKFVIVMPHWGTEYAKEADTTIKDQARELVAAGADAIIGAHPHVILEHVWMGDVPVFYSLGNLLFDQYFQPEVMNGNLVQITLTKTGDTTVISGIKIYQTSTESKKGVTIVGEPTDFVK